MARRGVPALGWMVARHRRRLPARRREREGQSRFSWRAPPSKQQFRGDERRGETGDDFDEPALPGDQGDSHSQGEAEDDSDQQAADQREIRGALGEGHRKPRKTKKIGRQRDATKNPKATKRRAWTFGPSCKYLI